MVQFISLLFGYECVLLWQGKSSAKRLVDVLVFLLYGYGCTPHPSIGHISFLTGDQSHIKIYSI